MKKLLIVFIALFLIVATVAGCGQPSAAPPAGAASAGAEPAADNKAGTSAMQPALNGSLSVSYIAYMKTKSDLLTRLSEGMADSPSIASMDLLGIGMVELLLLPMTAMGGDESSVQMALGFFNVSDIKYKADGNHYTVTYKDVEGIPMICETTYDPAKDAAVTKITRSDEGALVFEYRKTSYGYASQYCIENDDGTYTVYMGAFYNGADGIIGVDGHVAAYPASILDGAEVPLDFPENCESWYKIEGTSGTGKGSDGTAFDFTVPAEVSS